MKQVVVCIEAAIQTLCPLLSSSCRSTTKVTRRIRWEPGGFPKLATSHLALTDSLIAVVCQGTHLIKKTGVFCLEYGNEEVCKQWVVVPAKQKTNVALLSENTVRRTSVLFVLFWGRHDMQGHPHCFLCLKKQQQKKTVQVRLPLHEDLWIQSNTISLTNE